MTLGAWNSGLGVMGWREAKRTGDCEGGVDS